MENKHLTRLDVPDVPAFRRWRLPDLAAAGVFLIVEIGADLVRRHLVGTAGGVLSNPTAALVAATLWTYLAHTRYAFRASPRTGLATLPPYLVLCLSLSVATSVIGRGASGPTDGAVFAAAASLKFALLRMWLWPLGAGRRARAA